MDDTIYRQAAIDAIEHITSSMSVCINTDECHRMKRMQRQAVIELANLPSAQPKLQWIPCSERLPEDDTLMLVNYIDNRPDAMDIWIGWHEMENVWYIDGEAHSREFGNEVIAWMPLPEPWRGEEHEDY